MKKYKHFTRKKCTNTQLIIIFNKPTLFNRLPHVQFHMCDSDTDKNKWRENRWRRICEKQHVPQ